MSHFSELLGSKLVKNAKGDTVDTATALEGKYVGLYFSAHWCPPCRGFTPVLSEWYSALTEEDGAHTDFELVFVSSDKSEEQWKEYFGSMPFLALPYENRDLKAALSKKFKVNGIPSLIFLRPNGKILTTSGREKVLENKSNPTFNFEDWKPKTFWEVIGEKDLTSKTGAIPVANVKDNEVIGLYFSAHWCPPCKLFTPELAKIYTKTQEEGKKFEVIFVSGDRDRESFEGYLNEMPWTAIPYGDPRLKQLNTMYEVQGIPTLLILGKDGKLINKSGRSAVTEGEFPWTPPLVGKLDGSVGEYINDTPVMVLFTTDAKSQEAIQALTPLAEKITAETPEDEDPAMKVVWAGENAITTRVKDVCKIPKQDGDLLVLLDLSEGKVYVHPNPTADITTESIQAFADEFTAGSLTGFSVGQ